MEAVILAIATFIQANWAWLALVLPLVVGGIGMLLSGRLRGETLRVVGAVYRLAIKEAHEYGDLGLTWLQSPLGVAYRKELAERAYDALPSNVGGVPIGILKTFISRDKFVELVEKAFVEMVELADRLEDLLPAELV